MTMTISPYYDEIINRAVELLNVRLLLHLASLQQTGLSLSPMICPTFSATFGKAISLSVRR